MNDDFYEQLISRKSTPKDLCIRILCILAIVAVAILGMPLVGLYSFFAAFLLGLGAYYFVFPRLNVEYEYSILNYNLEVAAIYSKQKRKDLFSCDIREAEIMAPKNSPRLRSVSSAKVRDFSSGSANADTYVMVIASGGSVTRILLEPDERALSIMKGWLGMKLYRD